jgi:uncharacterized protein YndB with AHSA1/START domain
VLAADVRRVFDAWSRPEALSQWFVVEPTWTATAASDFRVGGDGTAWVELAREAYRIVRSEQACGLRAAVTSRTSI